MIVDTGSADIGMAEPFLHLGDVGLMVKRIGGGRSAEGMRADFKSKLCRVSPH
jgi:hypothetical protein